MAPLYTLPVSYTSVGDVYTVLSEVGSASKVTSEQIFNYCGRAEAQVNGFIVRKYALPLASQSPLITTIATDLACYEILAKRMFTAGQLKDSPWPGRFKEAMETLEKISDGEIPLVDTAGTLIPGRTDVDRVWSNTMGYSPTFNEGPVINQRIDPDKLDDIQDAQDAEDGV